MSEQFKIEGHHQACDGGAFGVGSNGNVDYVAAYSKKDRTPGRADPPTVAVALDSDGDVLIQLNPDTKAEIKVHFVDRDDLFGKRKS